MKAVICLDDKFGYSYNHRRQSKDSIMRRHLFSKTLLEGLVVNSYTLKSFVSDGLLEACYINEENFLNSTVKGYHFIENVDCSKVLDCIDELIVYKWNRLYVSDLSIDPAYLENFDLCEKECFEGSSHDNIEYCRYVRKEG